MTHEMEYEENLNVFVRNSFARFLCSGSIDSICDHLSSIFRSMMVTFQNSSSNEYYYFHFQTVDRRKCPLFGKVIIQNIGESVLIVFNKSRGNPLEYARFFKYIVDQLLEFI
jgi:hypothetical protein